MPLTCFFVQVGLLLKVNIKERKDHWLISDDITDGIKDLRNNKSFCHSYYFSESGQKLLESRNLSIQNL